MQSYEDAWEEFWKSICTNEDGSINLDQVKRELADYKYVLSQVPMVYCHITNDALSKANYDARTVIAKTDDCVNEHVNNCLDEVVELLQGDINIYGNDSIYKDGLEMAINTIQEYKS